MTKVKKMLYQEMGGCGATGTSLHSLWMYNMVQPFLENCSALSCEMKHTLTI